jgi:molybdopterin molybdotransferase
MSGLMPLADAQKAVLAGAATLGEETVALDDACDRVLSRDIAALRSQPPEAMSAMDGYAVRAADVASTPSAAESHR